MSNKIRSMELSSGTIVNFNDDGTLELKRGECFIRIHSTDLDTIRLQAIKNSRIEAKAEAGSNGVIQPTKETTKS